MSVHHVCISFDVGADPAKSRQWPGRIHGQPKTSPVPILADRHRNSVAVHGAPEFYEVGEEADGPAVDLVANWLRSEGDAMEDVGGDGGVVGRGEKGVEVRLARLPEILLRNSEC